jgi:hypothetical protein
VFKCLSYISPLELFRALFPRVRGSYLLVDCWVLLNTLVALAVLIVVSRPSGQPIVWLSIIVIIYGCLRVFEIFVYQVNVMLFDEYRARKEGKEYKVRGFRRIVILLLHNYFEVIFWFAAGYIFAGRACLVQIENATLSGVLHDSLQIMVSLSSDTLKPIGWEGHLILLGQSGIGVFMTLLMLARFVSLLPNPQTMDEFEKP